MQFEFAEYGKVFLPVDATDFKQLDYSDGKFSKGLYNFYNQRLAVYTVQEKMPFSNRPKEYGNYSFGFIKDPRGMDSFLFLQIQQRKECEPYLLESRTMPQHAGNRSYNQVRLTEVKLNTLYSLLMRDKRDLLTALIVKNESGEIRLKDYYSDPQRDPDRKTFPGVKEPVSLLPELIPVSNLDDKILAGLVNLLYTYLGYPSIINLKPGINLPTIILRLADVSIERRLQYIQSALYWLRPALGIITFALDFFSAPFFQFYFTKDEPPPSLFFKPIILHEADLKRFAADKEGYYQKICDLNNKIFLSQEFEKYLRLYPLNEAIAVARIVLKENDSTPPAPNLIKIFLMVYKLGGKDKYEIVKQALAEPMQIDEIIRATTQIEPNAVVRLSFLKDVLKLIQEYDPSALAEYFTHHYLVSKQETNPSNLLDLLKTAVQNAKPDELDKQLGQELKESLFTNLIQLGRISEVTFKNGDVVLKQVFIRPGSALNASILNLKKLKIWDNVLSDQLLQSILEHPFIWNAERQRELNNVTGHSLPSIQDVALHFLYTPGVFENFNSLPNQDQVKYLEKVFETPNPTTTPLFANIPENLAIELQSVFMQVCQPENITIENLRLAVWWFAQEPNVLFKEDYPILLRKYQKLHFRDFETLENKVLAFLFTGKIIPAYPKPSLSEAFRLYKLEEKKYLILAAWLSEKITIQHTDIEEIVRDIEIDIEANGFLAWLVLRSDESQKERILDLSPEIALAWLKKTNNSLRKTYLNNNRDQLFELICNLKNINDNLALYMLSEDCSSFYSNIPWDEYGKKIDEINNGFKIRNKNNILTNAYVEMVRAFKNPEGMDSLHRYGLRRLVERHELESQMLVDWDDKNQEIRLILTYALKNGLNEKIKKKALTILVQNQGNLLLSLASRRDDEIWSLHFAFEQIRNEKKYLVPTTEIFEALEKVGWQRKNTP